MFTRLFSFTVMMVIAVCVYSGVVAHNAKHFAIALLYLVYNLLSVTVWNLVVTYK
jgi:hypothetical protein